MGIHGLLPIVAPVAQTLHLSSFANQRVAIDGFVWLHRAALGCPRDIVNDPTTDRILPYLLTRLQRVIGSGVIPIVVFDGQSLPQKSRTTQARRADRAAAKARALDLESRGMFTEAYHFFQKAIEITSETVATWIVELNKLDIEYIVAPYEADAQLAFLARTGYVDCVMTEDGDLLAYQTPTVLFKLDDSLNLSCVHFCDVLRHLELTVEQFITVCCFAGCDYMDHIQRMGIQTALKLIRVAGDGRTLISRLRSEGKFVVPDDYEEQVRCAMTTFLAQRVFDPVSKSLVTLSPIEEPEDFLGRDLAPDLLTLLVKGELDTRTLEKLKPDPPVGPISMYFAKPNPVGSYFKGGKSGKGKCGMGCVKITSYFDLEKGLMS
jgi:exonuclease-1